MCGRNNQLRGTQLFSLRHVRQLLNKDKAYPARASTCQSGHPHLIRHFHTANDEVPKSGRVKKVWAIQIHCLRLRGQSHH
jgi:hypothetical protein